MISVMIRPRGGSFIYSDEEFEIMKFDILNCKNLGVKSVVFGILKIQNGKTCIDLEKTRELANLAKPM